MESRDEPKKIAISTYGNCVICDKNKKVKNVMGGLCDPHYDALMEIQFDKEVTNEELQ